MKKMVIYSTGTDPRYIIQVPDFPYFDYKFTRNCAEATRFDSRDAKNIVKMLNERETYSGHGTYVHFDWMEVK